MGHAKSEARELRINVKWEGERDVIVSNVGRRVVETCFNPDMVTAWMVIHNYEQAFHCYISVASIISNKYATNVCLVWVCTTTTTTTPSDHIGIQGSKWEMESVQYSRVQYSTHTLERRMLVDSRFSTVLPVITLKIFGRFKATNACVCVCVGIRERTTQHYYRTWGRFPYDDAEECCLPSLSTTSYKYRQWRHVPH